jgi:hypothetical protein
MVDANRQGKVSQREWNDFYIAFVTQFENSDSEPRDGVLDEAEVKKSIEDIPGFLDLLLKSKRNNYISEIMEILSSRTQISRQDGRLSLNLYEYCFLRKAAIAWKSCTAQDGYMKKSQI